MVTGASGGKDGLSLFLHLPPHSPDTPPPPSPLGLKEKEVLGSFLALCRQWAQNPGPGEEVGTGACWAGPQECRTGGMPGMAEIVGFTGVAWAGLEAGSAGPLWR